jgi:DNA-binding transcriptional LysR family regulator
LGVRPKIAHREASLNMVCSMVANGLGYSILNAHSKTQTAQDGKPFVARSFVETLRPLRFGAVWSERQPLGKTATGFLDFCRETVAQWMPDFE